MKISLYFFLLAHCFVFGQWEEMFRGDGDPCLAHHVNVISGNLQLFSEDAVVSGAIPIRLIRSYSSSGANERIEKKNFDLKKINLIWQMEGGWSFLPHLQMIIDPRISGYKDLKVYLREPNGEMVSYKAIGDKEKGEQTLKAERKASYGFGVISGRLNPNNNTLYVNYKDGTAIVDCADGGRRIYKGSVRSFKDSFVDHIDPSLHPFERNLRHYLLQEEVSPSGQITLYEYGDRTVKISQLNPSRTKTYSSVFIEELHHKPPFSIKITTSDQREIRYDGWSFKNQEYFNFVANGTSILDEISYTKTRKGRGASVKQLNSWGDEKLHIEYHKPLTVEDSELWEKKPYKKPYKIDKVKAISQCGNVIATFRYTRETTDVRDSSNVLTRYHHKDNELFLIEYFDANQELYSSQKFLWHDKNLIAKSMCNKTGEAVISKTFQYDEYGNIIKESLYGNFSGERRNSFDINAIGGLIGSERYSKEYDYEDKSHLLTLEREQNGLTHRYTYLEGTDLVLTKKTYAKDELLTTQIFSYDDDNLLIGESTDDGMICVEKQYKRDSANARITEIETGLSRISYNYTSFGQIAEEAVFDSNQNHAYTIYYKYDRLGHLISKSTPSGNLNSYTYAFCGDLLSSKEVGSPKACFTYDEFHRPISCTVNGKKSYTTYNDIGLISSKTDIYGNTTMYQYHPYGRCILTIFPEVSDEEGVLYHPTMECDYDLFGNTIICKNSKGEVKKTTYNILSKPILEIFPDGSKLHHFYEVGGGLKQTITQDESYTFYKSDIFGRIVSKQSALFKEKWVYSPTSLLSYTDETGLTKTFTYDEFGRKIEEAALDRRTTYSYDSLNFLESIHIGDITTTQIHNNEGLIIKEDVCGENICIYTYDTEGRKSAIKKITSAGTAVDTITYDSEGNIISHTDPIGATTQFRHENSSKTTIDPIGNITIQSFDALNRLIKVENQNANRETVSIQENFYDKTGNLARKVSHIYQNGQFKQKSEITWEYDFRGLVIKESQSEKTTYNKYDVLGRLITRILPNGVILSHSYDFECRLTELKSSDNSIHYVYKYDLGSNPIEIRDELQRTSLKRSYNPFGDLIHEINNQNLTCSWEYDQLGREKSLTLPDRSKIEYQFESNHMKKIERISKNGTSLYQHTYDVFNQNGHVHEESLIYDLGKIITHHDLLERPYKTISPHHKATTTYGQSGLVLSLENSLFTKKIYQYDPLKQLVKENEWEYNFDSIGNPSDLKTNEFCQLTSEFLYDTNGNPLKRMNSSIEYKYDALGRLTHIIDPQYKKIEFTYDAYSRLFSKTINGQKIFYLYDQEYEIGTVKKDGTVLDLKVLGLGLNGDIGAAIAIEIEDKIYAPLHDFQGNIIGIISKNGILTETCDYDSFGNETISSDLNPWHFCSKRKEEGLIYFGRRFYDPEYGRWLTPDPLGFFESTNCYLYNLNSPLNRLDLFGLSSIPGVGFYFEPSKLSSAQGQVPYFKIPPQIILCTSILSKTPFAAPADCIVISGFLHRIHFTPLEKIFNRANLINHMNEIVSKEPGIIGIITGQNGINTSLAEFIENSTSLTSNIAEGTTYIGHHNKSQGLIQDVSRTQNQLKNRTLTTNAKQTGNFLGIIADSLGNIQSNSYWLHIPHSEAGILFNLGYTTLSDSQQNTLKNQLLIFAIAPAEPISWRHCLEADNIYSTKDLITGPFGKKYKNNPNYNISNIKCESPRKEFSAYIADHAFTGTTYRNATTKQIQILRGKNGFYDSRSR